MGDVFAGDDEVLTAIVFAADNDMGVGMTRVEMIGGNPLKLGAEVLFHLGHQSADQRLQVLVLVAILRRDNEAELVAIALASFHEGTAVDFIIGLVVERTPLAVAIHTIALEVAQMTLRALKPFARKFDEARLHDHTALTDAAVPQHATNARAAPDAAAVKSRAFGLCVSAAGTRYPLQNAMKVFALACFGSPDASELWRELVVIAHAGLTNAPNELTSRIPNLPTGATASNKFEALEEFGAKLETFGVTSLDVQTRAWRTLGANASLSCRARSFGCGWPFIRSFSQFSWGPCSGIVCSGTNNLCALGTEWASLGGAFRSSTRTKNRVSQGAFCAAEGAICAPET